MLAEVLSMQMFTKENLVDPSFHSFQVCADNLYSDVQLVNALLERNTYYIGTVRRNRAYTPKALHLRAALKVGSKRTVPTYIFVHTYLVIVVQTRAAQRDGGKMEQGEYVVAYSKDGNLTYTLWQDSNLVAIISSVPREMNSVSLLKCAAKSVSVHHFADFRLVKSPGGRKEKTKRRAKRLSNLS